jgi:hypothetical protein
MLIYLVCFLRVFLCATSAFAGNFFSFSFNLTRYLFLFTFAFLLLPDYNARAFRERAGFWQESTKCP